MYKNLYDIFKHWYSPTGKNGTIWLYSDPHFSDEESYRLRFPEEFDNDNFDDISLLTKQTANKVTIQHLDDFQIKNINKKVGKNDTLIILGDVGNIECVKKLHAGYKVLILGNHDRGVEYYKRKETWTELADSETADKVVLIEGKRFAYFDNKLFDEVYEGTLQISPKIILSHEPVDYKYCLNIHGHVHNNYLIDNYYKIGLDQECALRFYIKELLYKEDTHFNVIAEYNNYEPVNFKTIIKSGLLNKVEDIHRETIDRATKNKNN